jgi:hypothetical protein
MVSLRQHFVLVCALVVGPVACETRPHNPAAAAAGIAAQTVMLLPLNVTATLPTELEARSDLVWALLGRYLKEHGKHVKTIRIASARPGRTARGISRRTPLRAGSAKGPDHARRRRARRACTPDPRRDR